LLIYCDNLPVLKVGDNIVLSRLIVAIIIQELIEQNFMGSSY
jgi:hypothetical protein